MPRLALFILAAALACATAPAVAPRAPPARRGEVQLTYLGVAGWMISDGRATVLLDPYFSRQPIQSDDQLVRPDEQEITAHAPAKVDAILVSHSHADHLLDAPVIALRTGAQLIGTPSSIHYARASGVPDDHLITVKGGEDFEFGDFSVRVLPSLHSALSNKHSFGADRLIAAEVKPPLAFGQFNEGGTLAFLVRMSGHQILFLGTANFIERELGGLQPDVAIVATGGRDEIHDYSCGLMRALGSPPLVLANHFDQWKVPLEQDTKLPDDVAADLAAFAAEVKSCSPATQVVIPRHQAPITLPADANYNSCLDRAPRTRFTSGARLKPSGGGLRVIRAACAPHCAIAPSRASGPARRSRRSATRSTASG